jgi:hypothetical protein
VLTIYLNKKVQWKDEKKSWILKAGALYQSAPYWKDVALKSPCKKLGVCWSNACERVPGPGSGLGYQWSPSPPPAHPWFSKRRTRDGRNGRTGTKFCRSLITQIVLSLRPCPPFSFPFQLSLWYIQQNITLKKLFFRNQAGERRKTAMRCRNGSLAPVWFYITNTQQLI